MASLSNLQKLIKLIKENDFFSSVEELAATVKASVAKDPVLVTKVQFAAIPLLALANRIGGVRGVALCEYITYQFPKDCQPATGTSSSEVGCVTPMITILEKTTVPVQPIKPAEPARTPWSIGGKRVDFHDGLVSGSVQDDCATMKTVVSELGLTYHSSSNVVATAKAIQFVTSFVSVKNEEYVVPTIASDKVGMPQLFRHDTVVKVFSQLSPVLARLPKQPATISKVSASQFFIWLDNNVHKYPECSFPAKENGGVIELMLKGTNAFTAKVLQVYCTILNTTLQISIKHQKLHFKYPHALINFPKVLNGFNLSGFETPANAMLMLSASRAQRGTDDNTRGETNKSFYTGIHLSDNYVQDVLNYKNVFAPALKIVAKLWAQNNHQKIELQIVADKGKLSHILALGALIRDEDETIMKLAGRAEFSIVFIHELSKSRSTISKACNQVNVGYRSATELDAEKPVLYWYDRGVEFSHKNHGRDKFPAYVEAVNADFAISTSKGTPFMIANLPAVDLYSGSFEPGSTPHNMRAFYISDSNLGSINTKARLSEWCQVSAILNWDRTCSVYTCRTLYDSLESAAKISEFAGSLVRPLAGTLIPTYRKALDIMELALGGYIEAEGDVIGGDENDAPLEVAIVEGDDDSDEDDPPSNNTSPVSLAVKRTFDDDDA